MCFARFDLCIEVRLPDILDIPAWAIYQRRPPVKVVVAACCWLINKLPCVSASVSLGTNKAVSIGSPTQVIPGPPYPGSAGTAGVPTGALHCQTGFPGALSTKPPAPLQEDTQANQTAPLT